MAQETTLNREKKFDVKRFFKKNALGWAFLSPVILGIIFFTIVPMVTSLNFAFHDYDPTIRDPSKQISNFGIQHFITIFKTEEHNGLFNDVLYSLYVTFRYTIVSLACQIVGSYSLALFLNQKTKGVQAFRIIYYLPNLIPAVAGTLLWKDMTAVNGGYLK